MSATVSAANDTQTVADFRSVVSCTIYNFDNEAVGTAAHSVESYANRNAASLGAPIDTS